MNPYIRIGLGENADLSHPILKMIEESCWIWKGPKTPTGYGLTRVLGRTQYVHRLEYESWAGPIPEDLVLDHLCRNKACYRPDHLEPVTRAENARRAYSSVCKNGHARTEENTYVSPTGTRQCRDCSRAFKRDLVRRQADQHRTQKRVGRDAASPVFIAYDPGMPNIPPGRCQCGCGDRTDIAEKTIRSRGAVKGQPLRYKHGHSGSRYEIGAYRVDESTGCWIWQRSTSYNGYGQVRYMGRLHRAHRLFYKLFRGPIPDGFQVHHECERPLCVNPDHLRAMTGLENVRASMRKREQP